MYPGCLYFRSDKWRLLRHCLAACAPAQAPRFKFLVSSFWLIPLFAVYFWGLLTGSGLGAEAGEMGVLAGAP
jgi:hypothetical protein